MQHLCHTASILSETGGAAAELELVKVEPGEPVVSSSPPPA